MIHRIASCLLLSCIAAWAQSPAGDYSGRYQCGGQWHSMELHIDQKGEALSAIFTFPAPVPGQPSSFDLYSFNLAGAYHSNGSLVFRPVNWNHRPPMPGYWMVNINGVFDAASRRYTGTIPRCGPFELAASAPGKLNDALAQQPNPPRGYPMPPSAANPAPAEAPDPAARPPRQGYPMPPSAGNSVPAPGAPRPAPRSYPKPPAPDNPRSVQPAAPTPNRSPGLDLVTQSACSLLSEAEAGEFLGATINKSIGRVYEGAHAQQDWPNASRVSGCQYLDAVTPIHPGYTPRVLGIGVISRISVDPDAVVAYHQAAETKGDQSHRQIDGVGDAAVWLRRVREWSQLPDGRLKIFVGGQTEVDVSVSGMPTEAEALEIARRVGLRLLAGVPKTNYTYNERPKRPALTRPSREGLLADASPTAKLKRDLTLKADTGDARAQFALAAVYRFATVGADQSLKPDYAAAAYWYDRAAAGGMSEAAYDLAVSYRDGLGVTANEEAAIEFFTKSAEGGYVPAMRELSSVYLKRDNWGGVMRALPWLEKAIAAGDSDSMLRLGYMENTGAEGIRKDEMRAMRHYEAAAALGNCVAMMNIGLLYYNGMKDFDRPPDAAQAQTWLAKAEKCDAADAAGVKQQAELYRQKAARGELPFFERRAPDRAGQPAARVQDRDLVALALVGLLALAVANTGTLSEDEANAGIKQIDNNLKFRRDWDAIRQRTERANQINRCQTSGGHWCY